MDLSWADPLPERPYAPPLPGRGTEGVALARRGQAREPMA